MSIRKGGRRKREGEGACESHLVRFLLLLTVVFLSFPLRIHPSIHPYLTFLYLTEYWTGVGVLFTSTTLAFSFPSPSLLLSLFPLSLLFPLPTLSLPPSPLLSSSSSAHPIHPSFSPPNPHKI
ncbi:hypothetical protein CABS01_01336 [Colletotrichum abscissum]|uniref:uncharacterized protein n=1 Tax=Colletotrichum abscissum TaxID=1671311 RepID=UPI0027D56CCD|nr:uncharacterized protein CABS01_01336 [Colletotrichum abscissum]KAK1505868.1 hypothetical protein CABS01_01336 [Colletotrichum abscissum]